MKKFIALVLCLIMVAACFSACSKDDAETTAPSKTEPTDDVTEPIVTESSSEEHRTEEPSTEPKPLHLNFNGLETATYTPADMAAAMGREPDFVSEQPNTTLHIYNNVVLGDMTFSQVQFSFNGDYNRISCTISVDGGLDEVLEGCRTSMTEIYGEPNVQDSEPPIYSWRDGYTDNYAMLTTLNETTVQLAFYLYHTN